MERDGERCERWREMREMERDERWERWIEMREMERDRERDGERYKER